ncbi:hypothetical protein FRX31_007298, partial [Thalictrum thalictroides]
FVEEVLGNWPVSRGTVFGRRVWSMLPYSVLWVLWKIRNERIFCNSMVSVERICLEIKAHLWFSMANWPGRADFCFQDMVLRWHEILLGLLIRRVVNVTT